MNEKTKAYLAYASVSFFWGTTYLAIRIGVEVMPPALFAGIRFFLAGAFLIAILVLRGYKLPQRQDFRHLAIVGIALLTIANGAVVLAEKFVPSSIAALVVATLPFWMVGIETAIRREATITVKSACGIILGFAGLFLLLWPDLNSAVNSTYLNGLLLLLIAPISWGAGSVYSKQRPINVHPLMAAAVQMLVAGVILVVIGALLGEFGNLTFDMTGWAALLYLLVFGSIVGYSSYIYALDKLPSAIVSTYAYINPIVAVVLGWAILDERLDLSIALGTAIILTGVLLVKSGDKKGWKKIPSPKIITGEKRVLITCPERDVSS